MNMSALPIAAKSEKLFLSNFHRRRYPVKSTMIYAGDVDGNDEKDMIVTYLNPGEFFGEMGLFEEHPCSAWIKTKTDCEVCEISYSKCRALYQKEPEILFRSPSRLLRDLGKRSKKQVIWRS